LKLNNPKLNHLSLLMPVYGAAPFLTTAIESVYKSRDVTIEFILILDRCINSEFWDVIESSPPNINMKVITSASPGIVPALNLGIASAKYELVARLDSDDLVSPDRFFKQVEYLDRFKEVVCVGTQLVFIDEAGVEFGYTKYPTEHKDILNRMRYQNSLGHPSVMFRKSFVQSVGGYREFLNGSEDYDLWLRLSEIGRIANLSQKLTRYRRSKFQATNLIKSTQPLTDSACRISAAMRKLMISETPPKSNQSLVDYNLDNIGQIQLIDPKTANELKAADHLNQAYREWSEASSTSRALVRVASCLFMTGWLSLGLLFSFAIGRFQFYSIDKQKSKRVRVCQLT
jgi:glycosyltransferase involved in cell wall biosynthesis